MKLLSFAFLSKGLSSGSGSAVYIHWGRSDCRAGSLKICSGHAAGGASQSAGPQQPLCLPLIPEYSRYIPGSQAYHRSQLTVFIYKLDGTAGVFDASAAFLNGKRVECAVCEATSRPSKLFIPARDFCPAGWTREYSGYLMGGAPHYRLTPGSANSVCVDSKASAQLGDRLSDRHSAHYRKRGSASYIVRQ